MLPWLREADGVLLSISSDAAVNHYEGWGLYGASKAALDHVTLTYAAETGLTAYAVDPGDMRTAMHQDAFPGEDISDRPLPETVVPHLLALLDARPESGRYRGGGLPMTLLTETPHTHFAASAFAPQPAEERGLARDEVRLLVATPDGLSHERFRDLPDHLARRRRAGREHLRDDRRRGRRRARRPAGRAARRPPPRRRRPRRRAAHRARRRRARCSTRRAGDESQVGDVRLTLREPWPRTRPRRRRASATGCGGRRCAATSTASSTGTAGRSPTATSTAATRWRATRPSSAGTPAAPRWRRPGDRSPTPSSPGW